MDEDLKKYLKSLGFEEDEIDEILIFAGNEVDTKNLKNKVEYLVELGCTPGIIRIVIEENPLLFTTELEDMKKMVNYLVSELDLKEDIIQVLEVEPDILSTSLENVQRNVNMMKMIINKDLLYTLYLDRMEIFTYNPDYLSNRLTYLINNGLKEKIYNIIINNIEIFEENIDEIDVEKLKNM